MKSSKLIKEASLAAVILLLMMFCGINTAAAKNTADTADKWQYEFTIYGWLPSLDGTIKYDVPPGSGSNVSLDVSDLLDSLNFVFMGTFVAQKNKLSYAVDLIYMDVSNSKSTDITVGPGQGVPLGVHAGLGLKTWVVTGHVGYDVMQTDKARMAVFGGVRYLDLSTDISIDINGPAPPNPPPSYLSGSNDFWDGIVGIKGGIMLNENWYIPYYVDIGTGQSKFTWQLYAGIGYNFSWGDIRLAYRYLEYDQDDDKLVQDLKLYGPQLGIGFRF
ncbi:MAG: hypothetical protein OES39_05465 [Desulfobulbaceae bacterium]|jgi:hypothetical protein|nr:hypothetical protein [Desulfobulbaceae bacterium]MDH3781089.1 hypothetical protein [Desulfobulbaceae bacterium]MDH3866523.1 hypothetical protein [Desulfobulbaceae bacterium]PLX52484.1 MAG: hypothetical protein C0612_02060 [Desulfobulbaceae bacterium]